MTSGPWPGRRSGPGRTVFAAAVLAASLGAASASSETTLGTGQLRLVGSSFDVEPVAQAVPVGVPAVLRTVFSDPAGMAQAGLRVSAELSGPGLSAPVTVTTAPGAELRLPPLHLKGEYRLQAIRLTDGGGAVVPALHPTATVVVTDVLVSSISSRVLTPAELADRGVVVDERNLRGFSFALGLAIQGRTISVELPPMVWTGTEYVAVGPPHVEVERPLESFQLPTVVAVPLRDESDAVPPDEVEELDEDAAAPTPVFGLLVFPGNVRFLNQFLSVVLVVQNGSPAGSALALTGVSTTVSLPASGLRLAGTTPPVAEGQPIPVRHPGPDGVLGTPDDLVVLAAQQAGSAEMVVEGLKVGTHEVLCELEATLDGLAGQPPRRLTGRARGSVVVRDPSFALTFHHPEVVRKDEEYELRVSVANTSTVRANQVSLSIDAGSLTGAVPIETLPGVDPVAALGDILPADAAEARFRLRATRTGRVVASAFTSDGSVSGSLRLRTGVTNDGTPLSPDTFVFPPFVSALPGAFVDAATRLIGIAHGLATSDATVSGSLPSAECSDAAVRERATELVAAARRVRIGQPVPSAVADVFLRWLGSRDEIPGFDQVRRRGTRGRELESAAAATLEVVLRSAGRAELERLLVDAAAANGEPPSPERAPAGPVCILLETGDSAHPAARLRLSDPRSGAETSGGPGEARALRELPFASLLPLAAPEGGEMGLLGRVPESGLEVAVDGRQTGSVGLLVLYPDGRGGFSRVRFGGVPVREGSLATIRIGVGADYLVLASSIDSPKVVNPSPAVPTPFSAVAAVQDVDANPLGKVVTLLFNRSVDSSAAATPRLWRLPTTTRQGAAAERSVQAVSVSSDLRLVSLLSEVVVSPVRPGRASGELVPGSTGETWSGELPVAPRLDLEGGEVEGRVLGPEGAPLANVDVRLSEAATDDLSGRTIEATTATSRTDGQGVFAFDFVRKQDARPFRIDAFDPATGSKGWAAGSIRRGGELVHVDVALLGRGSVRGVVLDGTGARIPGAIVRCSSSTDSYRSSLYSAADGSFSFASVPIGTLQLQAEEPRTRETTWASTRLEAPGASTEMTLVLSARPRARLSGRVVTGVGLAVAGAWVAGYGETGEYFGARQTPENGSFLFESAPAGAVRLEVFDGRSRAPALVQGLTLQPDGVHDVSLVLAAVTPRFGAVTGVVRRLLGGAASAVAGAPVWVTDGGTRTTSGADGSYRLDDVPVGQTSVRALLPASGRAASTSVTILEGVAATADLLFSDTSLGSVRGTVVDQVGQPRANALVEIWDEGPPLALVAGTRCDGDGAFLLERVPPGSWRIQATAAETRDGVALRNAGSATVTLPGPGATATATLALRGFVDVSGRVVARVRDRSGELVESPVYCTVEVEAGSFSGDLPGDPASGDDPERGRVFGDGPGPAGSAKTDPSTGAFRFRHVHGGPIRIVAKNPFYGERAVDLGFVKGDSARGPVDVVFDGNLGVVDGFLLDPSGAPVPAARVTLTPLGSSFGDPIEATTAADGSFLFPLVPFSEAGHLVFSGSLDGVDRWAEARASVSAEAPRARATLRVVPVGDVSVRVVTRSAGILVPVPGAQVRVEETEGPRRALAGTTNGEGIARFSGVSAVPLGVVARAGLVSGRSAALGAGEGFRVDTVVSLAEAAEVSGVVRHPSDGTGLEGVNVLLDAGPWKGILGAATTGVEGRFRIPEVPGGDGTVFRIRAEDPRTLRGGSSEAFTLAAGESRDVDVTIRAIGSVTGVVRTFDGSRPLAGAEVDVTSSDEAGNGSPSLRVSTATDGTYRADGIPEGTVLVRARDGVSGLSASASARLAGEGAVLVLDLSATATGRVRGSVLSGDGGPLPPAALAPEVRLDAGTTRETRLSAEYDFAEVDATGGFLLQALERVEPFHAGLLRGRAVAGQTVVANVRYAPFGTLRIRTVKPDPEHHGSFLPAQAEVVLRCGEPYVYRFPCGAPVRTDESGNLTLANVGVGAEGRLDAGEAGTGARGSSDVAPFTATGETRDVTVVLEPRGIVRGRFLSGSSGAPEPAVSVVLEHRDVRGHWTTVRSVVSGADGRFEARDVPLAGLVLRAVTTTGPLARSEVPVSLSAGAPVFDAGDLLLDAERPALVRVSPADGTSGVGLLPVIEAVFSEPLGAALFWREPREFVELTGPFGVVPSIVTLEPGETTLRIAIPEHAPLAGASPYQLRILGSLPDRSGLVLGGDVVVRFTTADLTAPTVLTSAPLPGQIQVGTDVNPVVVFTKAIDAATLTAGVRLERLDAPQGVAACTPALRADGRTVALNPARALEAEAEYAVVIDGVADAAGNRLPSLVRIPFLTRDDRPPVVTLDAPSNATPIEGSLQTYTARFADDDVARVRLVVVAATGSSICGERQPGPSESEANFSCRLPRIAPAGGTGLVLRAEAVDRSGNDALRAERILTLSPDAPPVLSVTSPAGGTRLLSGTVVAVVGNVEEDNGSVTVTARLGGTSRTASGPGSFVLALPVPIVAAASSLALDVSAVDAAGNAARPVSISLGVDPDVEPPTVAISSPQAGAALIGGRALPLVASASDDAGVVSLRWRAGGGAWSSPAAGSISVHVPTPTVAAETPFLMELEARDGAGNVTTGSRGVRLLPNLVPSLLLTAPEPGFRVTALGTFVVEGTAADDGGLPTTSATYRGTTRTATGTSFSFTFTAPAVSTPTETSVEVVAVDAEGNASAPLAVPVTVVPDAGGTPTIVLTSPVPALLLADEGASVALTYADNVGLEAGTLEVTGGLSSGGRLGFALAGTTVEKVAPLAPAAVPLGTPARVVATLRNVSARTASLDVALPVAFHRLESPLPVGAVAEGSVLAASFRVTPAGRERAVALRLEIGTRTVEGFATFACTQRSAPLAEVEVLSVVVPAGRTNLSVRSILVGADGSEAVAADVDGRALFERALATTADATPPTVAISAPVATASFPAGARVVVDVAAEDDVRLRSIEVTFAGVTKACLSSPCRVSFFAPQVAAATSVPVTAVAKDVSGRSATASVAVTVTPQGGSSTGATAVRGDGRTPRVSFVTPVLSPAPVAPASTYVPWVDASDEDGIDTIELFLGDDATGPCLVLRMPQDAWPPRKGCVVPDLPDGTERALIARATDRSGDSAEARSAVVVRAGLRVQGPAALVVTGDELARERLYVEGDVEVAGDLRVGELHLRAGSTLRPSPRGATPDAVRVLAEGDVVLDAGSRIDVSGTGTRLLSELDARAFPDREGDGAPHGGDAGLEPAVRRAYGVFSAPVLPGARGGVAGTFGGGVVFLSARRIGLAGIVAADGEPGNADRPSWRGLGSGGAIFLAAEESISGPVDVEGGRWGLLSARGASPSPSEAVPSPGALAAGGRIALSAARLSLPLFDVFGTQPDGTSAGQPGTIFVRDALSPDGALLVPAPGSPGATPPGEAP